MARRTLKVYPAYARTIATLIARGQKPTAVGVMLSAYWDYFQAAPRCCLKPEEWAPGRFEFEYLRNMHVVAIWGDEVEPWQFGGLLVDLMAVGPRLIWAMTTAGQWIIKDEKGSWPMIVHDYACIAIRGDIDERKRRELIEPWKGPEYHATLPQRRAYEVGQQRAAAQFDNALRAIDARGGDIVQFDIEQHRLRDSVERLFSDPYALPPENVAAA